MSPFWGPEFEGASRFLENLRKPTCGDLAPVILPNLHIIVFQHFTYYSNKTTEVSEFNAVGVRKYHRSQLMTAALRAGSAVKANQLNT
jgi:hypothetical protein